MKIQVVSDLHLEFSDCTIPNSDSDVLILSGDILVVEKLMLPNSEVGQRFRNFLQRVCNEFPHVVYVAGNHEFYKSGKFHKSFIELEDYCHSNFDNLHFLERNTKTIDDVVFVGGTLWTDMNKSDPITLHSIKSMMNDFRAIVNDERGYNFLRPEDTVVRHKQTVEYIRSVIQDPSKKYVVVGHHSPSFQSCHEHYKDDFVMNGAYHSSLENFILDYPQIKLWTHGHTHHYFDYRIGDTRVVCNPRGYEGYEPHTGWDPLKIFEI